MLTYETLRKLEYEEKTTTKLVKLPDNFFEEVKAYLAKKEKMSKEKGDEWELQSAKRRLQDLLEIRERKLVNLALYTVRSGLFPENLVAEEKEFFNTIVEAIKDFHLSRKKAMENTEKKCLVAILQATPRFVGLDLACYGPFKEGDITTLPRANAKLLVEKDVAELIEFQ